MKRFAVTVYVEAEDALEAVEYAGEIWVDVEEVHAMAARGEVQVRPARRDEVPA